jgi:predicted nucleic acid-binding protein
MATYYFDTSALVKLYVAETGSGWVDDLVNARDSDGRPEHVIALSKIALVEVAAAVARRGRLGQLDPGRSEMLLAAFLADCATRFFTLAVLDDQLRLGITLTQRQPLRGYDAVHLSTALDLQRHLRDAGLAGVTFVSADATLCAVAQAEGMATEDPNAHAVSSDAP